MRMIEIKKSSCIIFLDYSSTLPFLPPFYLDKESARLGVMQKPMNGQSHLKF